MKALIIGSGIGGLSAGIALRRIGYDVSIFEKVREIRPVGAGLSLWPNGIQCFSHLGLHDQVRALGGAMDQMAYVDGPSGETLTRFSLQPLYDRSGIRAYPVARAELQDMLMDEFGRDAIQLGRPLQALHETGDRVTAVFEDGEATGDLLIGADGAHSLVREHVLGKTLPRDYLGYVNYNGIVTVDPDIAPPDSWTTFVGEGKRASVMPIGGGRFYFFFDVPMASGAQPARDTYRDLLQQAFGHWSAPVRRLIAAVDQTSLNRVEIHDIAPLDNWCRGRVALLGDSAHNTCPDLGQGACMAVEDAVVLERALAQSGADIAAGLQTYQSARIARAAELVQRARARSDVTHGKDAGATAAWYQELRQETGAGIIEGILKTVQGSPVFDRFA
ncbi:FAD-dependent urate hydroxylase HpxO [Rhodobacteraceae bacterium]|nr:FAD-dependent urate hydroxylase HpxO [Paracoccaceae bacterium]